MPTYSQAPVDSYLAFLEEITEYEEKSIEEISAQAATINDEEIALPSYLSSLDQSDHKNDLGEGPSIYYVIECRGISINVSSFVEFERWWVLKSKIFGQESTYSKEKV